MKLTKTAALKGALLMVLAANMSWDRISFESVNLASTGSEVVGSTLDKGAKADSLPTQETPAHHTASALKVSRPHPTSKLRICGEDYVVTYIEFEEKGSLLTRLAARKENSAPDSWDVAVSIKADLPTTLLQKESAHRLVETNVKEYRAKSKESCGQETVATNTAKKEEDKAAQEEKDEEKKRIAAEMKNCTADKNGNDIKRDERLSCFVEQLSQVDKNIEKKDAKGKRLSEEALSRAAQSEVQRLQKEIKRLAKADLLSKDESRAEEAQDLLETAIDSIQETADVYDLGRNPRTGRANTLISKLIGELSALKQAGKTNEKSKEYAEHAQTVRDEMRRSYEAAIQNPLDPYAIQNLNNARREYDLLKWDIGNRFEPEYMQPLNAFKRGNMISGTDYNEFTQSFSNIQKLLKDAISTGTALSQSHTRPTGTIKGSVLGGDYVLPANLAQLRTQGTSPSTSRIFGSTLPSSAPVINLPSIPNQALTPPRSIFGN